MTSLQLSFLITIPIIVILAFFVNRYLKKDVHEIDYLEIEMGDMIKFYHNNEFITAKVYRNLRNKRILQVVGLYPKQILNVPYFDIVEVQKLDAIDEQGTPIVVEDGSMICNCAEPKQSRFPNGKWTCLKCWGEWYH